MQRERRDEHAQLLDLRHLIGADEVAVDEHGAAVRAGIGRLRGAHGLDELVIRSVSAAMRK